MSSIYPIHCFVIIPSNRFPIRHWKVDGALQSPNGITVNSHDPSFVMKAVFSIESFSIYTYHNTSFLVTSMIRLDQGLLDGRITCFCITSCTKVWTFFFMLWGILLSYCLIGGWSHVSILCCTRDVHPCSSSSRANTMEYLKAVALVHLFAWVLTLFHQSLRFPIILHFLLFLLSCSLRIDTSFSMRLEISSKICAVSILPTWDPSSK